jgi:hypothetical protein
MGKTENISKAKEIISEKDKEKALAMAEVEKNLPAEKEKLLQGIKADIESAVFWYKLTAYKVYNDLGYKTISDFIAKEFNITGQGKTKRIEQIRLRIKYLATIGNPAFSKAKKSEAKTKKTAYEKAIASLDDLTPDELIMLQAEIEKRLSASEEAEKEVEEEMRKAA